MSERLTGQSFVYPAKAKTLSLFFAHNSAFVETCQVLDAGLCMPVSLLRLVTLHLPLKGDEANSPSN